MDTTNGILRTIQNLLPAIRTRRQEIEQARCMPRDLVDELRKTTNRLTEANNKAQKLFQRSG